MVTDEQALRAAILAAATSPAELRALGRWLLAEAATREARARSDPGSVTYRAEYRRCGNPRCKCARGEAHGPYFYAYHKQGGRTTRRYVGRTLPPGAPEDGAGEGAPA